MCSNSILQFGVSIYCSVFLGCPNVEAVRTRGGRLRKLSRSGGAFSVERPLTRGRKVLSRSVEGESSQLSSVVVNSDEQDLIVRRRRATKGVSGIFDFEMRKMFYMVRQREIDEVGVSFFDQCPEDLKAAIREFCHAKRFWLAVKFCKLLKEYKGEESRYESVLFRSYNQKSLCNLFGIGRTVITNFISGVNSTKTCQDFRFMTPVECGQIQNNIRYFIRYASNLQSLVSGGVLNEDHVKAGMMKLGLDMDEEFLIRSNLK